MQMVPSSSSIREMKKRRKNLHRRKILNKINKSEMISNLKTLKDLSNTLKLYETGNSQLNKIIPSLYLNLKKL